MDQAPQWGTLDMERRQWAQLGPRAVRGPRKQLERFDACTSRHRRPRDPQAASGPEELRDSRRGHTDVDVTQ